MLQKRKHFFCYCQFLIIIIDLVILITRLGVNKIKPENSVRLNMVLGLRGPDISPGLDNRHLIIEGH